MQCTHLFAKSLMSMKSEKPERKRKQLLMCFFKGTVHFLTVGEVWGGRYSVAVALIAAQFNTAR